MARRGGRRKGGHLTAAHKAAISRALKGKKRGGRPGTKVRTVHRGRKTITRKKYGGKKLGNYLTNSTYVVKSKKKNADGSVTKTRAVRTRRLSARQWLGVGAGAALGGQIGAAAAIRYQNKRATNFKTLSVKKVTTAARRKKR